MPQRIATYTGQYVHCTFYAIPTLADGEIPIFISVDQYSDYCFPYNNPKHVDLGTITAHLMQITQDIKDKHPKVQPCFIMSYGNDFWQDLLLNMSGHATLFYDPEEAFRVGLPVMEALLKIPLKKP
jgi:hypothetical protein